MTQPAIPAPCEVCSNEPAGLSLMNLADYSNIKIGLSCAAAFFASMATDLVTAGGPIEGHVNESDDCPACQQLHDLVLAMTAPPEPEPAPEPAAAAAAPALDPADALPLVYEVDGDPPAAGDVSRETAPDTIGAPAVTAAGPVREPLPAVAIAVAARASGMQKAVLQLGGAGELDSAQCPADGTECWMPAGSTSYLCPWCAGEFTTARPAGPGTAAAEAEVTPSS